MDFSSSLLVVAVGSANVLGVGMLVPQTGRILRNRRLDGVSADWIGMGVAVNSGWLLYAWGAEVWGLIGVSLGALALYLAMAAGARRLDRLLFARARTTALVVLNVLGWAAAIGGVDALGLALAGLFTVQFAPAAWTAWTSDTVGGISPGTWLLGLAEAVIWAGYGLAIGDQALTLGGSGATAMSALILLRLWRGPTQHHRSPLGSAFS